MDFLQGIGGMRNYLSRVGWVQFLIQLAVLAPTTVCTSCGTNCTICRRPRAIETYRCPKRDCHKRYSLRKGTFFEHFQTRPNKVLEVIAGWILRYPSRIIAIETQLDRGTVAHILRRCRELIGEWLIYDSRKIGGLNHVVEIDESAFGRRKYHRGRRIRTRWVVGGIDRTTKQMFLALAPGGRRNERVLRTITQKYVRPCTVIMTDCWKGYRRLHRWGMLYRHHTVNHSRHFVHPRNRDVHTQTIESAWSRIKRDMRRRIGKMSIQRFETYMVEYMWRTCKTSERELFRSFIEAMQHFYPI